MTRKLLRKDLKIDSKNKKDEGHIFATSYKEHLKNIKKVRKAKDADE